MSHLEVLVQKCSRAISDTPCILSLILVFMGAVGVNMTVTTMNPTYRPEEIARQLENSETK